MLASFFGSSSPSRRAVAEAVPVRVNVPASGRLFPLAKVGLSVVDELSPGVDAIDCKPAKLGDASLTEWNPEGVSVWTGVLETPRALTDPGVLIDPGVPTPDCAISSSNWTPGIGPLGRGLRARTCHRRAVFFTKKVVKTAESRAVGCAAAARGRRGTRGTARGGASRGRRRERFTEWEVMRKIVFVAQFPFSPSLCNLTTHEMNCVAFRLRRVCAPVRLTCRHQTFNNYVTA